MVPNIGYCEGLSAMDYYLDPSIGEPLTTPQDTQQQQEKDPTFSSMSFDEESQSQAIAGPMPLTFSPLAENSNQHSNATTGTTPSVQVPQQQATPSNVQSNTLTAPNQNNTQMQATPLNYSNFLTQIDLYVQAKYQEAQKIDAYIAHRILFQRGLDLQIKNQLHQLVQLNIGFPSQLQQEVSKKTINMTEKPKIKREVVTKKAKHIANKSKTPMEVDQSETTTRGTKRNSSSLAGNVKSIPSNKSLKV